MYSFGAGNLFITPSGTNPTPLKIGTLQEVSFDISFEKKELYGNLQFPVAVGRGKGKIEGKSKIADIRGSLLASVFTNASSEAGVIIGVTETLAAAATVDVANKAAFAADCGVAYSATGIPLKRVAPGVLVAGTYSVAAGVYSFAAAEAGDLDISYEYTDAVNGVPVTATNQLMGTTTFYTLGLYNVSPAGEKFGIKLFRIQIDKLSLPFKNEDFTISDMDFTGTALPDRKVFAAYMPN